MSYPMSKGSIFVIVPFEPNRHSYQRVEQIYKFDSAMGRVKSILGENFKTIFENELLLPLNPFLLYNELYIT